MNQKSSILKDFTNEELKAELQRRKKEAKKIPSAEEDARRRMNVIIKMSNINDVEEKELLSLLSEFPQYEYLIQRIFQWSIKARNLAVLSKSIERYKAVSKSNYLSKGIDYVICRAAVYDILFMLDVDPEFGLMHLWRMFEVIAEDELDFLSTKESGGYVQHRWESEPTYIGYNKEEHMDNRNAINLILGVAKDGEPYSRTVRKMIMRFLRQVQSRKAGREDGDLKKALRFLRWHGAKWQICENGNDL